MPFNQNQETGQQPSLALRALIAAPMLAIAYYAHLLISAALSQPAAVKEILSAVSTGTLPGTVTTLAPSYYSPLPALDEIFRPYIAIFSPSLLSISHKQRTHLLSFLTDLAPLYCIYLFEASRRANSLTFARFLLPFGLLFQLFGIGTIAPVYYFLHYIQSPISKFSAGDQRMQTISYTKTALPALALAYLIPTALMFYSPSDSSRLSWNAIWQLFPALVSLTHYILTFFVTDTTKSEWLKNPPTADMKYIRTAIISLILLSAGVFNYTRFTSPYSLSSLFLPPTFSLSALSETIKSVDFISGVGYIFLEDHLACFSSSFAWLGLLFWDLKSEEMVDTSWFKIVNYAAVGCYLVGPGAVVGAAWLAREEVLATKAKGAVVRGAQ
jgi:hypothetical protein